MNTTNRIVCQFSCGAASAVATKLVLAQYAGRNIEIINALIENEHADNRRFLADCERWFGQSVTVLRDTRYGANIINVFTQRGYMRGQKGAPCTTQLKRKLLQTWEQPGDVIVFGFTAEEADRWEDWQERNPDRPAVAPLVTAGLGKEDYQTRTIRDSFQDFRAKDVSAPSVLEFLKHFSDRPRTYNAYRAMLRELMRFAEQKGFRDPGTNPVDSLKTASIKSRTRYITDSEVRRIKVAAMYGDDGLRTRTGASLCALIDMAYLTGQRIGDLLTLEWSGVGKDGINFQPAKIEGSTGAKVLIEWSPRLTELVARIKSLPSSNAQFVFCTLQGQPYTYSGASTAWRRAVKRAGIKNCHFHDLRSKALTDVDKGRGIIDAQRMGAHSTQSQTAGYVRHKLAIRVGATR